MSRQVITIYFLKCPLTNKIRYIGKTSGLLSQRLKAHMCNPVGGSTKEKWEWINELKLKGLTAVIVPIKTVYSESAALKAETKCIIHLRKNNIRIYNSKLLTRHRVS